MYPGSIPSYAGFTGSHTLSADNHAAQSNAEQADIIALATKMGTGASTPASGLVLRSSGAGVSAWGQVILTSDVSGVLPVANGGTGQASLTGLALPSATLSSPSISGGTLSGNPTFSGQPIITDLVNIQHTHASNNQGGQLNGANAIVDGTITPAELTAGTGSSWAWQPWTPTWTNLTVTGSTVTAKYVQIGKNVFFRLVVVLGGGNAPTGAVSFTLPVTSVAYAGTATLPVLGEAQYFITNGFLGKAVWNSTTTAILICEAVNGTYNTATNIGAAAPGAFTNGSEIHAEGCYEAV